MLGNSTTNTSGTHLPKRGVLLEAGERLANGDHRILGDRQDLFVLGKVLKYSKMDHLTTFTEKMLHDHFG
jgi:hypothetical protein